MEGKYAKIAVNIFNDSLCLKLNINNKLSWHETKINYDKIDISDFLFWWMLNSLKPLFFEMPLEKIDFSCSKDAYEKFRRHIDNCYGIARSTNEAMNKYSHLKNIADGNNNIIPFHIDGGSYRYKGLFEKCCNSGASGDLYLNMESGFNQKIRVWEDRDIPMPLSDLVDIIVKEGIKKIVSINHYVLERYLFKIGVHLIPLFRHLGIEYVILDNDSWDGHLHGYLMKSFFNCDTFDRFTHAPVLSEYWDNKYELKNVHYIAIPVDCGDDEETRKINEDYAVLVLSNSRLENVKLHIVPIIYTLDHMPEGSVFTEVQLWYMSLRHVILRIMKLDEFEQLYYNNRLHMFFYTIIQFLKYEIIESIDTVRRIEVYGDIGWETVFPEYYKKLLDSNEMDELFSENDHLYLLLNHSFSYLEAAGSIYDAIKSNVPFINMASLIKTRSFEGFRHIEYRNKEDLNYLIENIRTVVDNEELKNSIRMYRKILRDNVNVVANRIACGNDAVTEGGMFGEEWEKHNVQLSQVIEEYIDRNEAFLRESFGVLILGKPVQHDISRSRYFNKKYVQRIFQLIEEEKRASA